MIVLTLLTPSDFIPDTRFHGSNYDHYSKDQDRSGGLYKQYSFYHCISSF
jgi:hypothetical protein